MRYPNPYQSPRRPRPGRAGYWVAAGVVIAGAALAVGWILLSLRAVAHDIDGFPRTALPAELFVRVAEPGGQVVYYEGINQEVNFDILVVGPDGQQVPVAEYGGSIEYNLGGYSGRSLATFDADRPGLYTVYAHADQPGGAIAVSKSLAGTIVRAVVVGVVIGMGSFAAGLVLAIVIYLRRRRSQRLAAPAWPVQQPPAQWPGAQPPAPSAGQQTLGSWPAAQPPAP